MVLFAKVGEDQAPHLGDGGHGGFSSLHPQAAAPDMGLPDVCGKDVPVNQSLHEGAPPDIDSWRPFRGVDGFKLKRRELEAALACGLNDNLHYHRAKDEDEELLEGSTGLTNVPAPRGEPPLEVTLVLCSLDD